jgi:hypothetical protein
MISTSPTAQQQPANLTALQQRLQEMAASRKSSVPTTKPVMQGPVIVIRGK